MKKKITKSTKKAAVKLFDIKEFIPMIVLLFSFVLMIVGCFGGLYKSNGSSINPFTYLFKIGIDSISKAEDGLLKYLAIGQVAIVGIGWLLAIVSSLIFFVLTTIKVVSYVKNNSVVEMNYKKLSRWMMAFASPYFIFTVISQNGIFLSKDKVIIETNSVGWGPILVVIGLGIMLINAIYNNICEENDSSTIIKNISSIFEFVLVILVPILVFKIINPNNNNTYNVSIFSFFNIFNNAGFGEGEIQNPELLILTLATFLIATIFIPLFIRCKHNYSKIIFSSLSFAFYGFSLILLTKFTKNNVTSFQNAHIGISFYLSVLFTFVILGLAITSAILDKQNK